MKVIEDSESVGVIAIIIVHGSLIYTRPVPATPPPPWQPQRVKAVNLTPGAYPFACNPLIILEIYENFIPRGDTGL
ncbi:Hypothetical protein NTJ_06142 [Nesidiocoris tenuis]|uniref:Uncharacterized protein n=1 Tax=Nesidiocoris tenuis TaxID=355587 RepID=A0ABN7AMP6_9HEMI|nr:Hypothetical protein NTJ_06142 [Nesidiocoris tenuis]